jgi:mediator of RNA polymerase II transcription subunit 21
VLGPSDKIRDATQRVCQSCHGIIFGREADGLHCVVDALPAEEFNQGLLELSQDLIIKEQQIEVLISSLPGLENSERDQERNIRELEDELKVAEAQRQEAIREKDVVLAKVDRVIRSTRRP